MIRRLLLCAAYLVAAGAAAGADPPTELHGNADTFAAPGVALAWAVQRGTTEEATVVVVRVATDPAAFPWLALVGSDPFTKAEVALQPPTASAGSLDVRIPRARFADTPRTELRLFASAAAARAGTPARVVFYHGVPDTTPEFAAPAALDAHLAARIAALSATAGLLP
jgi:hypothetical protein